MPTLSVPWALLMGVFGNLQIHVSLYFEMLPNVCILPVRVRPSSHLENGSGPFGIVSLVELG